MKRVFNHLPDGDRGNALIDWTVLLAGVVMLALSVGPALTLKADKISGDASDRAEPGEDWLPS